MQAIDFAQAWEHGWNSHNIDAIMQHYRDDIIFRSQKAVSLVGRGEIVGKTALRAYWTAALAGQPDLNFCVQDVFAGYQMMAITYLNHRGVLAVETLYFDENDMVYLASACHKTAR